jgi:hypothetical protein
MLRAKSRYKRPALKLSSKLFNSNASPFASTPRTVAGKQNEFAAWRGVHDPRTIQFGIKLFF